MSRFLVVLVLIGIVTYLSGQQSFNMSLHANWNGSNEEYNDIWGYVDEQGREFAIIGSRSNTHFINIIDPTSPIEVDYFVGNTSTDWRDFKTYRQYAYGVSEGDGTLQIFDLSGLPNTVRKVFDSNIFFSTCHNIFIDEVHGRLYATGTRTTDMVVLDLTANPASPTLLKNVDLIGDYVHDIYVKDHIGYCSHEARGLYVYDFSDLNNVVPKGSITSYTNQGYNHSSWLSENGAVLAMADENHGLAVKLVAADDLTDMEVIATFKSTLEAEQATNSIVHNPFIVGNDYVVLSYYHDGVQIYNISDPTTPYRVAYYDTYPDNVDYSGYTGSWGVYPYLPSGNIIASDISNGLYVLGVDFSLTDECPATRVLSEATIPSDTYVASEYISATGTISPTSNVLFKAGNYIDLLEGFGGEAGSEFIAMIEACSSNSSPDTYAPIPSSIIKKEANATLQESLTITPNPSQGFITLTIYAPGQEKGALSLFDQNGRLLRQFLPSDYQQGALDLDLSSYPAGIYSFQLTTRDQLYNKKLVIFH